MDAQYPFASRDDLWRVLDELKDLHITQENQAERISFLERRRDDDARMKSVWGPLSPFPSSVGGSIPTDATFNSPPDAFKGFEQGQHHSMPNGPVGLDGEDEPRRGASRANSVRFDESAIHGYYGQASRSSTDLPFRTGSGMGSHPLMERSLSHRSDGRLSSSGHSHHSARTNSLGLETSSRLMDSSFTASSPINPPPGLFLLGPVPCIIRCWLTTEFTNNSLLYAAVCSGSYVSSLGTTLLRKLGIHEHVVTEEDRPYIKIPLYLPEASVHGTSRGSSPAPSLPSVTVRFIVREEETDGDTIQIIIGSDVLRAHNADILFSQDKIHMTDDERNRVSVPLVRPERDSVFRLLCTVPDTTHPDYPMNISSSGDSPSAEVAAQPSKIPQQSTSAPASNRVSIMESDLPKDLPKKPTYLHGVGDATTDGRSPSTPPLSLKDGEPTTAIKTEYAGVWSSWRRNPNPTSSVNNRPMKVLRPSKASTRAGSSTSPSTTATATTESPDVPAVPQQACRVSGEENRTTSTSAANPVGGASAFNWLNTATSGHRTTWNSK
ncbi:uncharacterized protein N7459_001875 [Penicillium hispanicum]|uniref:uncharacterized protein n=1 Tax=Penicillium hispanicum TaxID=1080232 RepID=UPI002541092C|nr:uncharacterized protein N7459_001875 [Penicillium hispanicum]KAJ5591506.1 hypothetical protein N7459_001875 [Penicillium hispanicum]